jgi:hypothetical protein
MRFRVRNCYSLRDVSRLVRKKWSSARELASLDVRHEALQPQTIGGAIRHSACGYDLRHFFVRALTFAHRFLAALTIAALPAAESTRFFTTTTSHSVVWPKAFTVHTPFNC